MASGGIRVPSDPHLRRWMMFVDGENFTIRGQDFALKNNLKLKEGPAFARDVFLWFPNRRGTLELTNTDNVPLKVQPYAIRAFYYTSVCGEDEKLRRVREALHEMGFTPQVFKKTDRNKKSKGVDISLTTDMLSNAFNNNFDVAVLVAGDGDYLPLVSEIKRLGKVIYLAFFLQKEYGMNPDLLLSSDKNFEFGESFIEAWKNP